MPSRGRSFPWNASAMSGMRPVPVGMASVRRRKVWEQVHQKLTEALDSTMLADLC